MLRLKILLLLVAAMAITAFWWWSQHDEAVVVGIDGSLAADTILDPIGPNTADCFLEENPDTLVRPQMLYYGAKAGDGQTLFENAMSSGTRFFITSQPSSLFVGNAPKFRDGRALVINTASVSPATSGLDDFVLRIIPDAAAEQRAIAAYLEKMPGGRLLVLQDTKNAAYTDPAYDVFAASLTRGGKWEVTHRKLAIADFRPGELRDLMAGTFDALYVLAGDFNTAIGIIAQLFHSMHPDAPILLTPWARSPMILDVAGAALGKITLASQFPARADSPPLDDYFRRYESRYGYKPQALAIMVRQALELLDGAFALGHRTPESVRDYLLSTPVHETSLGPVSFDAYGDTTKEFHFLNNLARELQ